MTFSFSTKAYAARLKALEKRLFRKPYLIAGWWPPEKPPGEGWVLEVVERVLIGPPGHPTGEWRECEWRKTKD